MERTERWYYPRKTPGSLLWAAIAHGALYGALLLYLAIAFRHHVESVLPPEEINYETLSEPPPPTQMVRRLARTPEPVKPEKIEKANTIKEMQDSKSTVAGAQGEAKQAAVTGAEGTGDALATPYYRIKPKYPRAALMNGVEGWVLLKIDVNEKGEVENVRVIGGEQRNMFQDEARRAVEKWKYKPFVDASGKPRRMPDHEVRVDFNLRDAV